MFETSLKKSILIITFCLFTGSINGADEKFSYKNPEDWSLDSPTCGGTRQSPISIGFDGLSLRCLSRIKYTNYDNKPKSVTALNDGHTVKFTPVFEGNVPSITNGPYGTDEYLLAQFHFHWGPENSVGSEHRIWNRFYSLELHLVHYNEKYGSLASATSHPDGVAVVGILFRVFDDENTLSPIIDAVNQVKLVGSQVNVAPFGIATAFQLNDIDQEYATYNGSLTTPPCTEAVIWTVYTQPQTINQEQIQAFRNIELSNGDTHNYRPLQPRNGRSIFQRLSFCDFMDSNN